MGCEPDVAGLIAARLSSRRIVPIHVRLRRLDAGYGGEHTYACDSDFLEWFEFLRETERKHSDVQFVLLGRLQEKLIELLRLPNVMSLRTLGLGLGHELTLMLRSDLFIGTSSGFAAMANFPACRIFVTRITPESCKAYHIVPGAERAGQVKRAWRILMRIEASFPRLCERFPEFLQLKDKLAAEGEDLKATESSKIALQELRKRTAGNDRLRRWLRRGLARARPWAMRLKQGWKRKHRIPRKVAQYLRRIVVGAR